LAVAINMGKEPTTASGRSHQCARVWRLPAGCIRLWLTCCTVLAFVSPFAPAAAKMVRCACASQRIRNVGTNLPSCATPNGQAAFLFILTSAVAPLVQLSYTRMVQMTLPYTIVLTISGLIGILTLDTE